MVDKMAAFCATPLSSTTASPPASNSTWTARRRHDAALADVEGNGGDMRRHVTAPLAVGRRRGISPASKQILERHHAVGRTFAEAGDIADRRHFGADGHGQPAVVERADAAAGDQRLGADPRQRSGGVGAAAQQRQRRGDHAGAPNRKRTQNILDDVGQLDRDNAVGRQSHLMQPAGNCKIRRDQPPQR